MFTPTDTTRQHKCQLECKSFTVVGVEAILFDHHMMWPGRKKKILLFIRNKRVRGGSCGMITSGEEVASEDKMPKRWYLWRMYLHPPCRDSWIKIRLLYQTTRDVSWRPHSTDSALSFVGFVPGPKTCPNSTRNHSNKRLFLGTCAIPRSAMSKIGTCLLEFRRLRNALARDLKL